MKPFMYLADCTVSLTRERERERERGRERQRETERDGAETDRGKKMLA